MKKPYFAIALITALSACSTIPPEAYYNRGAPESLLDVSSEVVSLDVSTASSVDELSHWLNEDTPSRAELYCMQDQESCKEAMSALDVYGVPYQHVASADSSAVLVYERVLARDCENRYIDNSINPYHLNHPTFGCSLAVNMVQHVSDKRQFVRPSLLDTADGRKVSQVIDKYLEPSEIKKSEGVGDSLVGDAKSE